MRTLIIKLGAIGDVVRTTVLLRELEGEIYWLTKKHSKDFLNSDRISQIYFMEDENNLNELKNKEFDLVINLEEDMGVLKLLKQIKMRRMIGVFLDEENKIDYSPESKYWFDMSRISKFGLLDADQLKKENKKSVPQIYIEMIGKEFHGQEYDVGIEPKPIDEVKGKIGLINVTTSFWKNKYWNGYDELDYVLKEKGYDVNFLEMRDTLKEHINDINNCEVVVCGDTFGMHAALALKKKVVAIFNCTPPDEIYPYDRMIKIKSPMYDKYFLKKEPSMKAMSAVSVEEVYSAVEEILKGSEKK